jgi:DNA-3-methyladenine glycosylase II
VERQARFQAAVADAVLALSEADPFMRSVILECGDCTLAPAWHWSPYESLIRAVSHQQLTGKVAETILGRFLALFPGESFPQPAQIQAIDDETMRSVGFSRSKIAAIRDICAHAISGVVPDREEAESIIDADLIRRLTVIRGVGQWTVEMLLIFTLGRIDVFPADDFGVKNGLRKARAIESLPSKREMLAVSEPWRPYRTIASWYLWRVAERPLPTATGSKGGAAALESV